MKIGLYGSRICTKNLNAGESFLDHFFCDYYTSVHVPQLVCALNDKALTVKVLGSSIKVELDALPEAAVVVPGGQLICPKF